MAEILSKSQLERLGRRLRKADVPSEEDLQLLEQFRAAHDTPMAAVEDALRRLGVVPTSRLKTTETIIEKLAREKTRLGSMHDIAGLRIVENLSLGAQDELVDMIVAELGGGDVIDRRARPSHGYRAVHVVAASMGCFVEIQVRTLLQNLWAQIMESLGDRIGRGVRYGELPDEERWRDLVRALFVWGELIAEHEEARSDVERREAELLQLAAAPGGLSTLEPLVKENESWKTQVETRELSLREVLQEILESLEGGATD